MPIGESSDGSGNLSGRINAPTKRTQMIYNLDSTPNSRKQSRPSRDRCALQRQLAHLHSIRLFVPDHHPRSLTDKRGFPKTKLVFITLPQQSSQLLKLPFAISLHWKLGHPTSSGVCPFLCTRVTQRVTQKRAHVLLTAGYPPRRGGCR